MSIKENRGYFGGNGTLEIAEADFTAAVTSCRLTPNTPKVVSRGIGKRIRTIVGLPNWVVEMTWQQDWMTSGSLAQKAEEWHGQIKTCKYTPLDGGEGREFDVVFEAGAFGGAGDGVHDASVSLGVNDQPVVIPAAEYIVDDEEPEVPEDPEDPEDPEAPE
jgi:hypothetical protein